MGVLFDKLHFMKRLEDAGGFTRPQAEALSEAFHQAVVESVATKEDVEASRQETVALRVETTYQSTIMRTELKDEIRGVRLELKTDFAALRSEVKNDVEALRSEVKNDIAALRSEAKSESALLRSEFKASMGEMRAALSESKVWAVSVGATVIAVLASIKYFG